MKDKLFYLIRLLSFNYFPFRFNKKSLLVLMFHQVNDKKTLFYPSMPVHAFKEMCQFVKKHYEVIHFSEINEYYSKKVTKPAAIITFDDGNYDIVNNVFPILKEMNLKFTINIDTEILETSMSQDFVRVYDILNSTKIDSFINRKFMNEPIRINKKNPIETEFIFTELLSNMSTQKRREFLIDMAIITKMEDINFSKVVSFDDLKKLSESHLVEIGSHSHSHSILTKIPEEQLIIELKHSKEVLENLTGKNIDIIAYPNGIYNQSVQEIAKSVGYKYILKTNDKINVVNQQFLNDKNFERVNQYHQTVESALAHTFGIIKLIRKFSK